MHPKQLFGRKVIANRNVVLNVSSRLNKPGVLSIEIEPYSFEIVYSSIKQLKYSGSIEGELNIFLYLIFFSLFEMPRIDNICKKKAKYDEKYYEMPFL